MYIYIDLYYLHVVCLYVLVYLNYMKVDICAFHLSLMYKVDLTTSDELLVISSNVGPSLYQLAIEFLRYIVSDVFFSFPPYGSVSL